MSHNGAVDELMVERVLRAVEAIPRGRVASYGDVAAIFGLNPRLVGRIMGQYGSNVCWWRVTSASGEPPPHLLPAARRFWLDEGIALSRDGNACLISCHRVEYATWHVDVARRCADISPAAS